MHRNRIHLLSPSLDLAAILAGPAAGLADRWALFKGPENGASEWEQDDPGQSITSGLAYPTAGLAELVGSDPGS